MGVSFETEDETAGGNGAGYLSGSGSQVDHPKHQANRKRKKKQESKRKEGRKQAQERKAPFDSLPIRLNSVSQIDVIARIVFPICFLVINYFYWITYLGDESEDAPLG